MKSSFFAFAYQNILRYFLFKFEPEFIHDRMMHTGKLLGKFDWTRNLTKKAFYYSHSSLKQVIKEIQFDNPIGLSAGFDKDANLISILDDVGFGFTEVGTATHKPYEGNPKPRLYRLKKSKGLVVYYGLKNIGIEKVIEKLKKRDINFPVILSIGKTNSKETNTNNAGIEDYKQCLAYATGYPETADIYDINISCPNTFGGEPFTTPKRLDALLKEITKVKTNKPIFIKMPINLDWKEFKGLADVALKYKIDGLIIGNLNKDHKDINVLDKIPKGIKGGISGRPTYRLSNYLISKTYQQYGSKFTIVGVGGIFSAEDAYEKIKRGASLVQLITGMIYQGPQLIGQINHDLVELLKRDGYSNVSEAVGAYYKN